MIWVIVSSARGKASDLNKKIKVDLMEKFNARGSKLPPHFTIKAPFETDDIHDVEKTIEGFSERNFKTKYVINGFNHFNKRVVYMNVEMSEEAKKVHDELIDELEKVNVTFDKKDGKDKIFHITLASKNVQTNFELIWHYILDFNCYFELYFDNIEIYKLQNNKWMLYRCFSLK